MGYIVISFLLLLGFVALFVGADSRIDEVERRRRYLG
jgi:hypothetical protein